MRSHVSHSMVYRMIASYLMILLLPIGCILGILLPRYVNQVESDALQTSYTKMQNFRDIIDQHISGLVSNALLFSNSTTLTPYALTNSDFGPYRAMQEMKKSALASDLNTDFVYYSKYTNQFYGSKAVYSFDWFARNSQGLFYRSWDADELLDELQSMTCTTVRTAEWIGIDTGNHLRRVISVMIPLPINCAQSYGVLLCWLDCQSISRLLPDGLADGAQAFIIDEDDRLVCSFPEISESDFSDDRSFLLSINADSFGMVSRDGERFAYASCKGKNNGWRYVELLPSTQLTPHIGEIKLYIVLAVAVIALAGIAVIIWSIRINYLPIKKLAKSASPDVATGIDQLSELQVIQHAMESYQSQVTQMNRMVESNTPIAGDAKLYALLNDEYESFDAFNAAYPTRIGFHQEHYCGGAFCMRGRNANECREMLEHDLLAAMPPSQESYCVVAVDRESVIAIFSYANRQSFEQWVIRAMNHNLELCCVIGFNTEDISDIGDSYISAATALRKQVFVGESRLSIQDVETAHHGQLSNQALYKLDLAIDNKDAEQIREAMQSLFEQMRSKDTSLEYSLTLFNCARLTLEQNISKSKTPILHMAQPTCQIECEQILMDYADLLTAHFGLKAEPQPDIDDVKQYLEKSSQDSMLSLQLAAEHYGMSFSAFSHYFKRKTGETPKHFVDSYRVTRTVHLLSQSDLPLDTIAEQTGFTTSQMLIRTIKKLTGKTPSSFRAHD